MLETVSPIGQDLLKKIPLQSDFILCKPNLLLLPSRMFMFELRISLLAPLADGVSTIILVLLILKNQILGPGFTLCTV